MTVKDAKNPPTDAFCLIYPDFRIAFPETAKLFWVSGPLDYREAIYKEVELGPYYVHTLPGYLGATTVLVGFTNESRAMHFKLRFVK